jgi:hypothetical protein
MAQESAKHWRGEKLHKHTKSSEVIALILLTSALLLATISLNIANVKAQGQATVTVIDSLGGTTDPAPGTYNYDDGTIVTLTATPGDGFVFTSWVIASASGSNTISDNPTTLTVSGGASYGVQALFETIIYRPPATGITVNNAIIVVLASSGGTTNPGPGTYAIADAYHFTLTATPNSGFEFSNWVISGESTNTGHGGYPVDLTPTDNPYDVGHGYGYTFYYQAVFVPVGTMPTPTPEPIGGTSNTAIIVTLAVVLVIVAIAFGAYAYTKRSKK